ncbi:hypothetical protein PRV_00935 [Mycoplasma parvum str. Indiana]|uniref:Uncharacterized protein n=1 Tax=Mycoplasma parvum str. Indiana TaxID=1403316 RepID=U5NC17_9MOLU|nr:hypothetical protein PRV_00935 [Mycoplasma parvum str. Indiana]
MSYTEINYLKNKEFSSINKGTKKINFCFIYLINLSST